MAIKPLIIYIKRKYTEILYMPFVTFLVFLLTSDQYGYFVQQIVFHNIVCTRLGW